MRHIDSAAVEVEPGAVVRKLAADDVDPHISITQNAGFPVGEGTVLNLHKDQDIEEEILNELKKEAKETEEEKVPTSFEENEAEVEVAEDEITEE